jgi:hypothetical protein
MIVSVQASPQDGLQARPQNDKPATVRRARIGKRSAI